MWIKYVKQIFMHKKNIVMLKNVMFGLRIHES